MGESALATVIDLSQNSAGYTLCDSIGPDATNHPQRNFIFDCEQQLTGRYITVQKMEFGFWAVSEIYVQQTQNVVQGSDLQGI